MRANRGRNSANGGVICYYTTFDEKERGSLEEGKIADMVILSENPYSVPADKLKDIKVEKLYLEGKEYKPQSKSVAGTVLSGLFSQAKA